MKISDQKEFFNKHYKPWTGSISTEKFNIMKESINLLGISKNDSVLDVACGTGVLYEVLKDIDLNDYVAIDISEKMLEQFNKVFPNVNTRCLNFDKRIELNKKFDYIVIFNSIPHFENMDIVFENAEKLLNTGGKFAIIHGRTRKGLKEHHKKIGFNLDREAIPTNSTLIELSKKHNFHNVVIKDTDFFYFSCVGK